MLILQICLTSTAISIDGLHGSDVEKYVKARPESVLAELLEYAHEYTKAFTAQISDSFPGTLAQFTGAEPKDTGVWYDDSWDPTYYPPGSNCKGPIGSESAHPAICRDNVALLMTLIVEYTEAIDYSPDKLFSGGINPAKLPLLLVKGVCTPIYPHMRLRVNTVWEVVNAAGLPTAYTDKHPAYDLVRGPSGKGLTTAYFPEISSVKTLINETEPYDQLHVNAILDWIKGITPANSEGSLGGNTPRLFGGNLQSFNVAQKQFGYAKGAGSPLSAGLLETLDFLDKQLGRIINGLKERRIHRQTLMIIASKHGQSPIDPDTLVKIDPAGVTNATGVPVAFQVSDTIALLWLTNPNNTAKAVDGLNAKKSQLKILNVIAGADLIMAGYGDPSKDPAVPNIIVNPIPGVIYTNSKTKLEEHGGIHEDDRNVACIVANPGLKRRVYSQEVSTKQVGPTILRALGLKVADLAGAKIEGTQVLPGF